MPLRSPIFKNARGRDGRRERLLDLRELASTAMSRDEPVTLETIKKLRDYGGSHVSRQVERRFSEMAAIAKELGVPVWRSQPSAEAPTGVWPIVTKSFAALFTAVERELELLARLDRQEQDRVRSVSDQKKIDRALQVRADRVKKGLCATEGCTGKASDTLFCRRCRDIQAGDSKTRRDNLRALGLCVVCGREKAEEGRVLGPDCAVSRKSYLKDYHDARADRGLCKRCGMTPPLEGKSTCEECLKATRSKQSTPEFRERRQQIKDERRSKGFCVNCWTKAEPGKTLCKKHLDYARKKRADYLKKKRGGA